MFYNILQNNKSESFYALLWYPGKIDLYKVGKLDPVVVSELFNDERNIDGMMDK